jgi:hypothetical protein
MVGGARHPQNNHKVRHACVHTDVAYVDSIALHTAGTGKHMFVGHKVVIPEKRGIVEVENVIDEEEFD